MALEKPGKLREFFLPLCGYGVKLLGIVAAELLQVGCSSCLPTNSIKH